MEDVVVVRQSPQSEREIPNGDVAMRLSRKTPNVLSGVELQVLLRDVLTVGNGKALRDILIALNVALSRAALGEKTQWVNETLEHLLTVNQPATAKALGDLLEEMSLHYGDPLVQLAFEGEIPTLLSLLGDLVQRENQLLQLRIRAMEALFMRSTAGPSGRWIHGEAEGTLRFLNQVVSGLERGSLRGIKSLYQGLLANFESLNLFLQRTEKSNHEASRVVAARREILHLVEEALRRLAVHPASRESVRVVLEILKVNTPLPAWHPSALGRPTVTAEGAEFKEKADYETLLALIADRAIEIVLQIASIGWAREIPSPRRADDPSELFSPSDPGMLKSAVEDPKYPLKLRRMAAALLKILGGSASGGELSPRSQFFSDLFLLPYRSDAVPYLLETKEGVDVIDSEVKIPFLLEALGEKSDYVRWVASRAGLRAAQDHPEWFRPNHYTKLLPLLTDEHRGVRLRIVQIFNALASLKEQQVSSVIRGVTDSLTEKFYGSDDTAKVRRDLEGALGATLGSLMENVEELQGEVRELDERRRQLIGYIEVQTVRIGEEIHHEILNTLCGYLATAIDEEQLGEARKWLDELVADLRRIMNRLYPRDLETVGFLSTIRKRLEDAGAQARKRVPEFQVEFDCPPEIRDSDVLEAVGDPSHVVFLYRIVLEAIINARKHSGGTRIGVKLSRPEPGLLEISIYDDGRGGGGPFEQNVGIPLMLRRAQEIGAEIVFRKASAAGGTAVVIRFGPHSMFPG